MNAEQKEIFVSGGERLEAEALPTEQLLGDPELREDLRHHCALDKALRAMMDDQATATVSDRVMQSLSVQKMPDSAKEVTGGESSPLGSSNFFPIAALIVVSLIPGFLVGRFWPAEATRAPAVAIGEPGFSTIAQSGQSGPTETAEPKSTSARMLTLVEGLSTGTFAEGLAAIENSLLSNEKSHATQMLIYQWAAIDPEEALGVLLERNRGTGAARSEIESLFSAWGRVDTEAAVEAARGLNSGLQLLALNGALGWLAKSDPARFVELAGEEGLVAPVAWQSAFSNLRKIDVDASEELLERITDPTIKAAAIGGIAEGMAATDPALAIEWAESLADPESVAVALEAALSAVGQANANLAGEFLAQYPGRFPEVESSIMQRLRGEDPFSALSWVLEFPGEETQPRLLRELLRTTARESDNRVFALFDTLIEREGYGVFRKEKDHRLDDIFWGTSGLDMEQALDWVQKLPDDVHGRQSMPASMIFSWAKHDRQGALAYVQQVEDPALRRDLNTAIVNTMLSTSYDFEQTWNFISTLPPNQHVADYVKVIDRWARLYPSEAAKRITGVPAGQHANKAVANVAGHWGTIAPLEAAQWAADLGNPKQREIAVAQIARSWADSDLMQASEWIGSLETGFARDLAVEQLVGKVAPFEGDSAFAWALDIGSSEVRERAMAEAVEGWAERDAAAAKAAVSASSLSAREQTMLLDLVSELVSKTNETPDKR